jgi:hypothetical protein
MLSYPIPEAEDLLSNKLSAAQQSLSNCEEDLDFLREQVTVRAITRPFTFRIPHYHPTNSTRTITAATFSLERPLMFPSFQTMEVATARVYNWDISQKRKEEKEAGGSS